MSRIRAAGSLTEDAYKKLREEVVTCRLVPDQKLVTNELCSSLGVSLGAVREALSRLTSEGLVVSEPQRGFRVAPISIEELEDLTAVRVQIECMCVDRAIERGDVAWEGRIMAAFHEMSRIPQKLDGDVPRLNEDWTKAHAQFHAALAEACHSPWLLRLRELLFIQSERYRRYKFRFEPGNRDTLREHRQIMQAAIGRDREKTASLLTEHLRRTARVVVRGIERAVPQIDSPIGADQDGARQRPAGD